MPAPFEGELFTFYNPDGSEVRVRGWGNQFAAVFETLDGYTVVQDPQSGFYHYATLSEDRQELVPSDVRVGGPGGVRSDLPQHLRAPRATMRSEARAAREATGVQPRWQIRREQRQAQRRADSRNSRGETDKEPEPAGTTGNYVGLVILVAFPDVPGTITQAQVNDFCNTPGHSGFGNNGSAYDYFLAVSDGKLRYTNQVTAYYTARHPRAHYTDPAIPFGTRARELIIEALNHLKAGGYDFSGLSSDSGGFVYALSVFYAGPRVNNWSQGLWPHAWSLASPYAASSTKKFSDYQITDMGAQLTLGTFCHENGHMVCDFPDLYDYGGESAGVGNYSLMCYGGSETNPVHVDAYLKNEAGWTSKLTTLTPAMTATTAAGTNDFLIHKKSATEYFILENRQQAGRDASLPDAGLAIWHVDEDGNNSNEQMTPGSHYELSLEQADNRFDLEHSSNAGDTDDLYGSPSATAFGDATAPNSRWWDGTPSGLEIESISAAGQTITVKTQGGPSDHPTIKKGSQGDAVKLAQKRLIVRYYDPGPIDGRFGAKTEKAVKQYQGDRLLLNDGIVGPKTWARLDPPTIKNGARGQAVKLAQQLLKDYGYNPGPVDSIFGPQTEAAVRKFQTDYHLTVDGIVGPKTWAMLGS